MSYLCFLRVSIVSIGAVMYRIGVLGVSIESEHRCVRGIDFATISTIFRCNIRAVLIVWYD